MASDGEAAAPESRSCRGKRGCQSLGLKAHAEEKKSKDEIASID
jgi:hypothetical protein